MSFPISFNNLTVVTPSVKDAFDDKFADIKKMLEAKWAQANRTYIQLKNQMTNQVPVNMEQLNIVLKSTTDKAEEYINTTVDNTIYSKTGYHLSEYENMLTFGNQIWSAVTTMNQTGNVPQPEWIVDIANTIKKCDKTNNVYIDETVTHINTYWNKYKEINKQYSGLLDMIPKKRDISAGTDVSITPKSKTDILKETLENEIDFLGSSIKSQYAAVESTANNIQETFTNTFSLANDLKDQAVNAYTTIEGNITDDISTWKNTGVEYYNDLKDSYADIKQQLEDASAYYNMFKDPKELKKTLNNLLQGWLSSQNETLCNVFMINKFKTIIADLRKIANEGFKKDEDTFTKIESAISMFEDIKELLYSIKNIPVADNYEDMIDIDISGIESKINRIKETALSSIDTVRYSIENTVNSLENMVPKYSNYISGLSDTFGSIIQDAKASILDIKDYFENFFIDNIALVEDIKNAIVEGVENAVDISFDDIFNNGINIEEIKSNIEINFKSELLNKLITNNKNFSGDLAEILLPAVKKYQDSSIDTSTDSSVISKSFQLDVSINIGEIFNSVIRNEVQSNIEHILGITEYISEGVSGSIESFGNLINDSASTIYGSAGNVINKTSLMASSAENMINNSLQDVYSNVKDVTTSLSAGIGNFISISEDVFSLDDLMPNVKIQAPPFIKYFINILDILNPVINLLSHLVSNYRTNKQMTREAALLKLSKMNTLQKLKDGFKTMISNVKDIVTVTDTASADFIRNEMLEDRYISEWVGDYGARLTPEGVNKYNEYLAINGEPVLLDNFDGLVILNDSDNLEIDVNTHTREVLIKDKTKVPASMSSAIMEKMGSPVSKDLVAVEGIDLGIISREMVYPELKDDIDTGVDNEVKIEDLDLNDPEDYELYTELKKSEEEYKAELKLKEVKDIRSILKFKTDEFEGQQNLNTDVINLCENPVSLYNNTLPYPDYPYVIGDNLTEVSNNPVIIEFAQDTINDEGIDFTLMVDPGETITENHNIALVSKNDQTKIVKSIFKNGIVRKNEEGGYVRVYNNDRNIIIDNPEYSVDTRIIEEIQNLEAEFDEENELYDLITAHLMYSVYPEILLNSESKAETLIKLRAAPGVAVLMFDTGETVYDKLIKHFKKTEENYHENILGKKKISKKEAKETFGSRLAKRIIDVKGNGDKIKEIADDQLNKRQEYIIGSHYWDSARNGIINMWESYIENNDYYYKCRILNNSFEDIREYLDLKYYIDLYSNLDTENNPGDWFKKYKELLNEIINYRRSAQGDTYDKLITLLNETAFKSSDYKLKDIPKNNLWAYLEDNFITVPSYQDFSAYLQDKIKDPEETPDSFINKLYNIYEYIKHNDSDMIKELDPLEEDSDLETLLKKENNILKEFWTNAVKRYKEIEFTEQKKKLESDEFAEMPWPEKVKVTLDKIDYDLYLFKNTFSDVPVLEDEVMPDNLEEYIDGLDDFIPDTSSAAEDFNEIEFDQKKTTIDYTDIRYWFRWCSMATLANCVMGPRAWATGMIFNGYFIQFPCILIPFKVINIKFVKMTIVIGLAIRLIDIKPMIIYVNQYNEVNNINIAITAVLEKIKEEYNKYITYLEKVNLNAVQLLINKLENNNDNLTKENRQLEIILQDMHTLLPNDWMDAKREIQSMVGQTEIFQNVYRIKNYPKLSDFNTKLNLRFGEAGGIFNEQDFSIDFANLSTEGIKNELAALSDPSTKIQ